MHEKLRGLKLAGQIFNGIERECLRVSPNGEASKLDHPSSYGSKLTHRFITTDYSESLLEFISSVHSDLDSLFQELLEIHYFVYANAHDGELLWPVSMPAILPERDEDIKVAYYGESNIGKLKEVYRVGLGHRYGKKMQSIAGLHFNFSLSDLFWKEYQGVFGHKSLEESKNKGYFSLIRNYKRYQWLLPYFFGASPAVDKSFVFGRKHKLESLNGDTLGNSQASSLRMGGLGYTSKAQEKIRVCYNALETYLKTLEAARLESIQNYEEIGLKEDSGEYKQLNTNLLQIDNEFYSTIRPKRTSRSKESALQALKRGGVEYIEVRIMDINPFDPLGISREQAEFLNVFLVTLLLMESPEMDVKDYERCEEKLNLAVSSTSSLSDEMKKQAKALLQKMEENLELFSYDLSLGRYYSMLENNKETFSQKLLEVYKIESFIGDTLKRATKYKEEVLKEKFSLPKIDFEKERLESLEKLSEVNERENQDFGLFLQQYFENIRIDF